MSFRLFSIILQSEASSTDGPGEPGGDVHGPTQAGDQAGGAAVRAGPPRADHRQGGARLRGAAAAANTDRQGEQSCRCVLECVWL